MIATHQRLSARPNLTPDRVARLCRFVQLLGTGPKTREVLVRKLKVDTRGFYRDFEKMRQFGVAMEMHDGRYVLIETVEEALGRLPFPDPGLSVQEAMLLSRGNSKAHKKLRERIANLLGKSPRR
jgi:predicted DNA-binding transcriptional regulator YafY